MNQTALVPDLTARDGLNLHLTHWLAPQAQGVVVLLHGLTEHAARHHETAQRITRLGWSVIGPDLRGHGLSGGPRGGISRDDDLLHDLACVLDHVAATHPGLPVVLLGNSLGGAVASRFTAALAQPPEDVPWARPVKGLILTSPALEASMGLVQKAFLTTMGHLIQDVPLPVVFKPEWANSDPAIIEAFIKDPLSHRKITARLANFMASQGQITLRRAANWTVPTLLLYSPQDRLISPQACQRFGAALPPALASVRSFPGLAHDLLCEPQRALVHQAIEDWLLASFPKP
jgi:alpha-beta hydrolase superfamily lysophospholipase